MRTPEVEIAISNTKAGMYCTDDADTLAAEVERLEAETARLRAHLQRLLDWGAEIDPHASEPAKVRYAADVAAVKAALAETKEGPEHEHAD